MNSETNRQQLIKSLYLESFPEVARYIAKKGGSLEDAREIFQEAMVHYYEAVVINQKQVQSTNKAYLFGICKNLWSNYFNHSIQTTSLNGVYPESSQPTENTLQLSHYLQTAGQKCLDLLQSFYYEKLNMSQLAGKFGFKSERSATVQKYKCLEKVRNEVKSKSLTYEDFIA